MNCRDISTLLRRTRWWGKAAAVGAFFALGLGANAQTITGYTRTVLSGQSFVTMASPTTRTATGTPASPAFTGTSDDGRQTGLTLPWTFTYDGVGYTDVVMCTNGWISFGADQGTNDLTPGNAFTTTAVNRAIRAWHGDGNANFGITTPNGAGSMQWGVDGTGNRYVFQWNNNSGSGSGASSATNSINYQIVIDGPSSANPGRIQIIYGASTGTISTGRSIAIEDAVGGTGRYINAINGLSNSTTTSTAWPGSGAGYQFDAPVPCSGTPNAGSVTTPVSVCSGSTAVLSATGLTSGLNISYQWQESPDGSTGWASVVGGSGATTASYTTTAITTTRYFRLVTTCSTGPASNNTNVVTVNAISPTYTTFNGTSFSESFESWSNLCGTTDVPTTNWKNDPVSGNNSWRRNDQGTSAAWTSTSGAYTPVSTQGSFSARFHSFNASSSSKGNLDLYIDMTAGTGSNGLLFDYINTSGGDSLTILQSTNGGASFTRLGAILTTAGTWTTVSRTITSTSATTVIRLRATSDFGATDIGVDNFQITSPCSGTPNAGTAAASPASVCSGSTTVITATGLSVGSGLSYQWEESPDGSTGWAAVVGGTGATTASYTTTAITATRYFRLTTTCSTGPSTNNTNVVTVTVNPGSFAEDFSSGTLIGNCWTPTADANLLYSTSSAFAVGTGSIRWNFFSSTGGTTLNFTSPVLTPVGSGMQVTFDVAGRSYTGGEVDTVHLEVSNNGGSSWTIVQTMTNQVGGLLNTAGSSTSNLTAPTAGQWTSLAYAIPAGTDRVRFRGVSDFGNSVLIDNIAMSALPSCLPPTSPTISNITANSVDLSWTCTGCTGDFVVEYGPSGYTPGTDDNAGATGTLVSLTATSGLTISGLSSLTAYTFVVRQYCGGVDYSPNATVNATTALDCDAISTTISCGSSQTASWAATAGQWNVTACGFSTPGAERLYKFTAPVSGSYVLNITAVSGTSFADWFFKPVSAGCGATGWTCIDDNSAVGTDNFTLSAGVEYYLLADPESASSTFSQTFQIDCPCKPEGTRTVVADCSNNQFFLDVNVTSLGTSTDVDITTNFVGDTEPTSVGLGVTQIGPYPSGTSVIVTLVHDGGGSCNQVLSSISFTCPPVNDDCANALPLSCNSTVTGTTIGASNTGSPGFGCANSGDPYVDNGAPGVWYTLQGWDGPMTVSLCGSSYDTQIAVVTGTCGAFTCVAGSDDFCSTQSQASWTGSSATTYYVYVTGWLTASGNFTLSATCGSTNPACTANGLNLEFQNDANPGQVTWEVLNAGNLVVLSGSNPIPANSIGTQAICLPDGCYRLRVLDSGGDGMTTGGYELRTQGTNERIIDNTNNFSSGSVSAISNNQTFCLPIGTDKLIYSSCDKLDWVNNKFIVASANPLVSAQFGVTNTTSGYEFWFFDPNGSYSYRRFRSHATSDGFGTGATRACHFKVNGWINTPSTPHLPNNVLLNVRVRGREAGNNFEFGPACQFKLDAALAACPRVKLQDDPANTSDFSCGVNRNFGGASSPSNRIYAAPPQPIPAVASSAVRYQFRFRIPGENICIVRPPQTSARLVLNWTTGTLLECSKTYEVDVRVSLDGGATWCFGPATADQTAACADTEAWGKVCLVTINPCAEVNGGGNSMVVEGNNTFTMYPNPNRGDQLFLSVSNVEQGVNTVNVDIFDMTGKRVMARTIAVQDGFVNTNMELNGDLAGGLYVVNITAGTKAYTERLVIQP